jgi:hypothetical protein
MGCIDVLNRIDSPYPTTYAIFYSFIIIIHLEEDMPENRKQDDLIDPLPYRV